jgi:hypothetical protein
MKEMDLAYTEEREGLLGSVPLDWNLKGNRSNRREEKQEQEENH